MSVVGQRFAYRERMRAYGEPVRPVEVVREGPPRSNKVRVLWLDGEYEGLEEWTPKMRLLAPWEEAEALIEDERRMVEAVEHSEEAWDDLSWGAVETVFFAVSKHASAEDELILGYKAFENQLLFVHNLESAAIRYRLDPQELRAAPFSFIDRFGSYRGPFQTALKVAERCCRTFPREVLRYVQGKEDELREDLISSKVPVEAWWFDPAPRREYAESRLAKLRPVYDLVRNWCGQEKVEEFDQMRVLRGEVDQLRDLVLETSRWLRDHGHPVKASLLRNQLAQVVEEQEKDPR